MRHLRRVGTAIGFPAALLLCGLAAGPALALQKPEQPPSGSNLPDPRTWPPIQGSFAVTMTVGQSFTFLCKASSGTLTAFTLPTTTSVTVGSTTTRALVVRC